MPWPWSSKKSSSRKQADEPVEFAHEEHARARVNRLTPEEWKGRIVSGFLKGDFTELKSRADLENRLSEQCGGGAFYADVYKKGQSGPFTRFQIKIAGDPLMNGKEIKPLNKEDDVPREPEPSKPVKELEQEIEVTKKKAELQRIKKESGMDGDDGDEVSPVIAQLQAQVMQLAAALEDKSEREDERERQREERDREERRHKESVEMMREQSKQSMAMMTNMMTAVAGNKGGDADMFKAQVDVMREISSSNAKQIETVMKQIEQNRRDQTESSQKMFELVLGKSDKVTEIVMEQARQTVDARGNSAGEQMEFFNKALTMALSFSEGKAPAGDDDSPQSWAGFADRLSSKLFDTVNGVIALKGQQTDMSKEKFQQQIETAAKEVADEMGSGESHALPAPETEPATNPAPARPAPARRASPAAGQRNARAGMDKVLKSFIHAAKSGHKDPWSQVRTIAVQSLPPNVLSELASSQSSGAAFASVLLKYGSEDLAKQALQVGSELAETKPPPNTDTPPKEPAKPKARKPRRTGRRVRPAQGSAADAAAAAEAEKKAKGEAAVASETAGEGEGEGEGNDDGSDDGASE